MIHQLQIDRLQGISLNIDQYNTLLAAAPLIEAALAQKDVQVVRPDYEADLSAPAKDSKDADTEGTISKADEDAEDAEEE